MSAVLTPPTPAGSPPAPPLMTADEFLRRHGDDSGVELVNGRITRQPMPGLLHGEVCLNVGAILREFVKGNRLGRVFGNDSFVRVGPDGVRGADVMFISYATLPADVPTPTGAIAPPLELVVEVRSPTDSLNELTAKAVEYNTAGVTVVLILDPESRFVGVFRSNQLPVRLEPDQTLTLPDVLPGFAVPVARFFE